MAPKSGVTFTNRAQCFVIEDSTHGVEAALAGGMIAIGVATTRAAELLGNAHWVAGDMTELNLAKIQSLFEHRLTS